MTSSILHRLNEFLKFEGFMKKHTLVLDDGNLV